MSYSSQVRKLVVAAVGLALVVSCTKTRSPRFGTLRADARPFRFQHGIELLQAGNGMKIALLRDTRTNLVTIDVRYTVGAAEDPEGRAGMAHLAEHLLFLTRTEPGEATLGDRFGEASLYFNASTNHDETHYTTLALDEDLERVLELEARRMEFSCSQLDESLFLRERDVVLEEEAYRASALDDAWAGILATVWGPRHPYARRIGTREIADATRDEACDFIDAHYGPDRAILVVTGNFDMERIQTLIGKRFGPIQGASTRPRVTIDPAELDAGVSEHVADVDEASAFVFFRSPPWGDDEYAVWDIVTTFLAIELDEADDKHPWITSTSLGRSGGWRAPATTVQISVSDPDRLADAVELVYATAEALGARKAWPGLGQVRGPVRSTYMSTWDLFPVRGGWLADYLQYTEHNWFFLAEMAAFDKLTEAELQSWSAQNLARARSRVAMVRPSGKQARDTRMSIASAGKDHDVKVWRTPVDPEEATRPVSRKSTRAATRVVEHHLDNGLRVLLAPDPESPLVVARMVYPVGTASDPSGRRGLATVAAAMLEHDADRSYPIQQYYTLEWLFGLGTQMATSVDETSTIFEARGLAMHADWHVWRLFWLLDLGHYDGDDLRALRENVGKADDGDRDVRDELLRERLFGSGHPYSRLPMRGADLEKLGGDLLADFRSVYYRPKGATLIVTGGFDAEAMRSEIAEFFGGWGGGSPPAAVEIPAIAPARGPSWIGVRDPEVSQPRLTIAFAAVSDGAKDRAARAVLQKMLEDRARVVREGMGATYGVSVGYPRGAGDTTLRLDGALDPDKAGKAMRALLDEIAAVRDGAGDLVEDFVRARRRAFAEALGDSAGAFDLAGELTAIVHDGLPLDHASRFAEQVGAITLEEVAALAARDLAEPRMVVVLSGRRAVIEKAFADAGIEPELFDED